MSRRSLSDRVLRQRVIGVLMLPLSLLPFLAYFGLTDQGRLIWQRIEVAVSRPSLPELPVAERRWAREHAPSYRGGVAVLVFHGIGSLGDGDSDLSTSPERFGEQLAMLETAGMNTVTAAEVAEAIVGDGTLPPNAVMISFDDGRSDAMMYADPMLADAGMRATMFVITGAADDPGVYYESWDGLRRYEATGRWDLQSHSDDSHHEQDVPGNGDPLPALTSLGYGETPAAFADRVSADLRRASAVLEREMGTEPVAFAYPFGAHGTGYDERTNDDRLGAILAGAVSERYLIAFDQDDQAAWGLSSCADDPYHLHRLEIGDWTGRQLLSRIGDAADAFVPPSCAD
jgi:peptidoglycan/xylan/chitin deacetylase (PgdA/CDA1 family)